MSTKDYTGKDDRRQTPETKGWIARPIGKRVAYLAARTDLIEMIVDYRVNDDDDDSLAHTAAVMLRKDLNRDNEQVLLEEAEFLEIEVSAEMREILAQTC